MAKIGRDPSPEDSKAAADPASLAGGDAPAEDPAPTEGSQAGAAPPFDLHTLLHQVAGVRDRAMLAVRQHDLPTLAHAVHDLADVLHRMMRGYH